MAFFKQTRELLLIEHSEKAISDEELRLLLEENTSRNPEFSYENYERFNLEEIEDRSVRPTFVSKKTTFQNWLKFLVYQAYSGTLTRREIVRANAS